MPLPRVDHDDREFLWHLDGSVLERAAVEEQCATFAAKQRRRLVEDPRGHSHGSPLRALAGEGELQRLDLELGRRTERERDNHLEGARGAETRALRQVASESAGDSQGRSTERCKFQRHRRGVATPAARVAAPVCLQPDRIAVRGELDSGARIKLELDPPIDRDGQDEPTAVVRVLADHVDASGSPAAHPRVAVHRAWPG